MDPVEAIEPLMGLRAEAFGLYVAVVFAGIQVFAVWIYFWTAGKALDLEERRAKATRVERTVVD